MSRAFGNRMLKQFVVAEPEIQVTASNCNLLFLSKGVMLFSSSVVSPM